MPTAVVCIIRDQDATKMSDAETERRLDALVAALSDDDRDGAGTAVAGSCEKYETDVKSKTCELCLTEPYSGIRYRDPNIGATALDSLLDRFTPLHHLDKLRESLMTVSTIAIIGRRTAATSSKGTEYIKWQLTDAAGQFSQIRPGTVVAFLKVSYDSSQQGCLKVNDTTQMKEVGVSVDFAYCAGHNRKGDRCQNVVNKSSCPFCDHHLQQGRKKLVMGARPECQGTVLGAVHGAQMKNAHCLTKLSQRTPTKKKPQSLDQMKTCAGQASNHRAGSMGAKLIARFVQQQHQAARSAKLDQQEAALYCSPDKDSNRVPRLPMVPIAEVNEPRAADSHSRLQRRAGKRGPGACLERPASKAPRPSDEISRPGARALGQDTTDGKCTRQQQGGAHTHSGYVSDLLQEIAAERNCGQAREGDCQEIGQHRRADAGAGGPARKTGRITVTAYAPGAAGGKANKSKRPMSTERKVRRVLTDLQ